MEGDTWPPPATLTPLPDVAYNLMDKHDKSRFHPIPFNPLVYLVADGMCWGTDLCPSCFSPSLRALSLSRPPLVFPLRAALGSLPSCPKCGNPTLVGSPSGWTSCKGWASWKEDKPCTFQTDKRLQYGACSSAVGCGAASGSGEESVLRLECMPGTGRGWEMPGESAIPTEESTLPSSSSTSTAPSFATGLLR